MANGHASRRTLLKAAVGLGGALALDRSAVSATNQQPGSLPALPTVALGSHRVTRLILGSNPFNGFCYSIPSLSAHMKEWCTPAKVAEIVRQGQQNGINTWQFSYYPSSLEALKIHQAESPQLIQWIILTGGTMRDNPGLIPSVAKLKPMAIVHHGGATDQAFKAGKMDKVRDYLKAVRDSGVLVGLSTHLPTVIEHVEEGNWDIDFYMTCFYQFSRTPEEIRKMLGELPLGYVFLEGDPARMCRVIKQTSKTCLAYKILAAGRLADSTQGLENAFRFAFANIKPQDAVIVGMYPRFKDEVSENAAVVRKIFAAS